MPDKQDGTQDIRQKKYSKYVIESCYFTFD